MTEDRRQRTEDGWGSVEGESSKVKGESSKVKGERGGSRADMKIFHLGDGVKILNRKTRRPLGVLVFLKS